MIKPAVTLLPQRELDILDGPVFPVKPWPEYFVGGDTFGLSALGELLYACAFAKVGMRLNVKTLTSRRNLDEAVYRGREILYDLSEATAKNALAMGAVPTQLKDLENACLFGTMKEVLAAGTRLDAARLAGPNIVPFNFKKKRRE